MIGVRRGDLRLPGVLRRHLEVHGGLPHERVRGQRGGHHRQPRRGQLPDRPVGGLPALVESGDPDEGRIPLLQTLQDLHHARAEAHSRSGVGGEEAQNRLRGAGAAQLPGLCARRALQRLAPVGELPGGLPRDAEQRRQMDEGDERALRRRAMGLLGSGVLRVDGPEGLVEQRIGGVEGEAVPRHPDALAGLRGAQGVRVVLETVQTAVCLPVVALPAQHQPARPQQGDEGTARRDHRHHPACPQRRFGNPQPGVLGDLQPPRQLMAFIGRRQQRGDGDRQIPGRAVTGPALVQKGVAPAAVEPVGQLPQ